MKSPFSHLGIVFIICTGLVAGYCFLYSVIVTKSVAVVETQNQIDAETETASRSASVPAIIAKIADDETAIQKYFVQENGVMAFINTIEALGKTQGTTITVLSVSADGGAHPTLLVSLSLEGTFDAVVRTVGAIEHAPYDISLSKLSLKQDGANSWHADLGLAVGSTDLVTTKTP